MNRPDSGVVSPFGDLREISLDGLDLERDGDLVADDDAATLERHLDVDAEVLAVDDGLGVESGDGALAHARLVPLYSSSRLTGLVTPLRVKSPSRT